MDLRLYDKVFNRGASRFKEALWVIISGLFFYSWLPGSIWRVFLLRAFSAKIGKNVVIKPYVKVKFPWRLEIGNYSWIGEEVWIDNLDKVIIGSNVCISQGVYICTGNHNFKKESFDLITKPVIVGDGSWVCAKAILTPGAILKKNSFVRTNEILNAGF